MEILLQLTIIAGVSFAGEIMSHLIPFPMPASVYALCLMFALLYFKIVKLEWVDRVGTFLISVMLITFIPAVVSFMDIAHKVKGHLPAMIFLLLITLFLVMGFTGVVAQVLLKRSEKKIPGRARNDGRAKGASK